MAERKKAVLAEEKKFSYEEKKKAIDVAISHIEKEYGKGAVMKLGDKGAVDVETVPTGSISLDKALGVGGIPKGRIIEIYGPESGGKTTLALHIIAEAQNKGGIAGFIDAEHALDPSYAARIGVDINDRFERRSELVQGCSGRRILAGAWSGIEMGSLYRRRNTGGCG